MSERPQFPPPPGKSLVANRDGTMSLGWLTWFGALSAWVQRVRVIPVAVDVPSIAAGSSWWGDVTVAGAALGDFAWASIDPGHPDLSVVAADVRAADTVRVRIQNYGASPVDLAAGTLRIRLEKAR